jgi:hypothetical protein
MRGVPYLLTWPSAAFSEEETKYFVTKFSGFCRKIRTGDRNVFDRFCQKIYPFCLEIYEFAKDLSFDPKLYLPRRVNDIIRRETPCELAIYSVGAEIASSIIPTYKNYLPKSESLHEMLCNVINEEKFTGGRSSFILEILPKTKRSDGIDIKRLISEPITGGWTIPALLKLKDGRFVEEAKKYLKQYPNDWFKKKIALYIERYS